jgi:hypothetical protein
VQPEAHPAIYRIATRKFAHVPTGADGGVAGWQGLGSQWITGSLECYHCGTLYRNWHTGEQFSVSDIDDECYDLDSREKRQVHCPKPSATAKHGGRVVWNVGTTVHGYDSRTRRRVTWRLPAPVTIGLAVEIERLDPDVIVTVLDDTSILTAPVAPPDVYRLRWPRRR